MKRLALVIGAVLLVAVVVVGFAYAFGVPQQGGVAGSPAAPFDAAGSASPVAEAPTTREAPIAPGEAGDSAKVPEDAVAPPPDPSVPLAIEIPGCVCHSDDQKLVEEHKAYRMNQCAGCHIGGVPTGQ